MNEIDFFIEQLNKFEKDPDFAIESKEFNKLSLRINQFIKNNENFWKIYKKKAYYFVHLYNYDFAYDNPLLGGLPKLLENLIQANQFCSLCSELDTLDENKIVEKFNDIYRILNELRDSLHCDYNELENLLGYNFKQIKKWLKLIERYKYYLIKFKTLDIEENIVIDVDKFSQTLEKIEKAHKFYTEKLWTIPIDHYVEEFMLFSGFIERRLYLKDENIKQVAKLTEYIFKILQVESNKAIQQEESSIDSNKKNIEKLEKEATTIQKHQDIGLNLSNLHDQDNEQLYFKNGILDKKTGFVKIGDIQKTYYIISFEFILLSALFKYKILEIKEIDSQIYSEEYLSKKDQYRKPQDRIKRLKDNIVRSFKLQSDNNPEITIQIRNNQILIN